MFEKKHAPLLTRKEVSELLKVNLSTIARWLKTGVIRGYKVGGSIRFKSDEIESFLHSLSNSKNEKQ